MRAMRRLRYNTTMKTIIKKALKWYFITVGISILMFWAVWIVLSEGGLPLSPWHKYVPDEMSAAEISAADWDAYIKREEEIMEGVRLNVTEKLPPSTQEASNRYDKNSFVYAPDFAENWNRSFVLMPDGKPVGAAVFLHGMTDSPYSLRHIAKLYRKGGFVAVGIRMPGHGTVPGGLTDVKMETWDAAAKLAVREAVRIAGEDAPLHIVGYSNGGALAMKYALDALGDSSLRRPDRLVLLSPMIGVTLYARFAGLASVPAILPAFAKAAWQNVAPEYNPFKYNSSAINGARQSYRLTHVLQKQIQKLYASGALLELPPVLTFQSVLDSTVSTPAIFYYLYEYIPANGSEMVLFDINRAADLTPLMDASASVKLEEILPPLPLSYTLSVVTNDLPKTPDGDFGRSVSAHTYFPGAYAPKNSALGIKYPPDIFSLSHVSIPFPMDDELYGMTPPPDSTEVFGVNLGAVSARGEKGTLIVDMESLFRIMSNPFFPYMVERIQAGIDDPAPRPDVKPHVKRDPDSNLREREVERLTELEN